MRSPIAIVDVDRPATWTKYRNGLCDDCAANCCTMPVEVKLPDLVRLGLVDDFEAEQEPAKQIAKRLYAQRPNTCRLHTQVGPRPGHCPYGAAVRSQ